MTPCDLMRRRPFAVHGCIPPDVQDAIREDMLRSAPPLRIQFTAPAGTQKVIDRAKAHRAPYAAEVARLHGEGLGMSEIGRRIGRSHAFARSVLADIEETSA